MRAFLLIPGAAALLVRQEPKADMGAVPAAPNNLTDPFNTIVRNKNANGTYAAVHHSGHDVNCTKHDILPWKIEMFSSLMGCHLGEGKAMCRALKDGGCDSETCYQQCRGWFEQDEDWKTCRCNRWTDTVNTYMEEVPQASCPRQVTPRCHDSKLYMSECHAVHILQKESATKDMKRGDSRLTVVPKACWPKVNGTAADDPRDVINGTEAAAACGDASNPKC